MLHLFWQTVWYYLVKVKRCVSHDLAILFLGIGSRETLIHVHKGTHTRILLKALCVVVRKIEMNVY